MSVPGPPTNDAVRHAVERLNKQPSAEARLDLYRALMQGMLLLGIAQPHGQISPGFQTLPNDVSVSILTSTGVNGERTLLAFTDVEALRARNARCPFIGMECRAVLEQVVHGGFSALIINPAGPWAAIPSEDIRKILERPTSV